MDKNLLLAVSLSILVYAAWFGLVEKRIAKPATPTTAASTTVKPEVSRPEVSRPEPAPSVTKAAKPDESVPAEKDSVMSFTFEKAEIKVRSRGAAVVSWKFHGPRGIVELIKDPNPGMLSTFPELSFTRVGRPDELTFAATRPDKLRVVKQLIPSDGESLPRMHLTVENPTGRPADTGEWTLSLGPGLGTIPTEEEENDKVMRSLGLHKAEGGLNGKLEVLEQKGDHAVDFRWLGIDNRYFLAALLPVPADFAKVTSHEGHRVVLTAKSAAVPAFGRREWDIPFYIGAKGQTWLSRYKLGLERSIDFGFFAQLGRFVLKVLDKLHSATGNWGWAIILLTVLLQIVVFPLTYKSLKAAAAMKRLQPEIAKLQQRYAKEPQKLNAEMMALYKTKGANPLGGCLPMLLQMPVFIALYNALRNAWELHGASWILWINDLSAKDPYYVLPLLMGGLMFAQNKLSPQAGADPTQQQMMTFMPIIFTVMFLSFPSGLVLYWMTNSLVSTLAQVALKNRLENA